MFDATTSIQLCRHCQEPVGTTHRPRGLCHRCYLDRSIRECYPNLRRRSGKCVNETLLAELQRPREMCKHCQKNFPRSRGICRTCYEIPEIRVQYEPQSRTVSHDAMCQHCRKFHRSRPRGLCRNCHADKEIRNAYPALRNGGGQKGPATILPPLGKEGYCNVRARLKCACGDNWDGECRKCEWEQRERMVIVNEETLEGAIDES